MKKVKTICILLGPFTSKHLLIHVFVIKTIKLEHLQPFQLLRQFVLGKIFDQCFSAKTIKKNHLQPLAPIYVLKVIYKLLRTKMQVPLDFNFEEGRTFMNKCTEATDRK